MTLTPEERRRFAEYCEQEATAIDGMVKTMQAQPALAWAPIIEHKRLQAALYAAMAKELRANWEASEWKSPCL